MLHLTADIEQVREDNRRIARVSCDYLDLVQRVGLRPADLLGAQTGLRKDLLGVEHRLRRARGRAKELRRRLHARVKRHPGSRDAVLQHLEALRVRERVLVLRRLLLRQIADAFVWLVLRHNARLILPLHREQTHQLPHDEGLGGPAEIARQAMESGRFLVIENDLTRCVGLGDLTVVSADSAWKHPLPFEVKSSARPEWKVGGQLGVQLYGAHSGDPIDVEIADEFERAIGGGPIPVGEPLRERPEQTAELLAGAELLVAASRAPGRHLPLASPRAWKTLNTVLSRALADGSCYDLSERGVVFMAIRSMDDRAPEAVSTDLFEKVREVRGFDAEGCKVATSVALRENDEWSALVLPIALWPVSRDTRVALLCGELFLACIVRPNTWRDAMEAEGLDLTEDGGGWIVTGSSSKATHLDVLEVAKLTLGLAFSGVSPREIAADLAASLNSAPSQAE